MRFRWLRLLPLALLALVACASTSVVRTDLAERRWYSVESPHVTLFTDLDAHDADDLARAIETRRRVLVDLYQGMLAPGHPAPSGRLIVVHLEDCTDLQPLWGDRTAGRASIAAGFVRQRIALTCEEVHGFTGVVVTHELAHLMNFHFFRALPPWLEEGLATYFESLVIAEGEVVLGEYPAAHHQRDVSLPPLARLLAMADDTFRALESGYLAAWRLVHLLATGSDDYNARFRRLLRAIGEGTPAATAWNDALGDIPFARLVTDYQGYLRRGRHDTWVMPYTPRPLVEIRRRPLSPGDVHDVWMQSILTFGTGPHRNRYAAEQLALAERHAPSWPGAHDWRAVLAADQDRPAAEIEALLRRFVALAPDDVRGWTGLLLAALAGIRDDGLGPDPAPGLDALRDEMAALQRHARSAAALDAMARYFALARKPAPGEGLARRALAIEPGCATCETTLATLLFQRGAIADAVEHQERAIRLLGEATPPSGWLQRLALYRERARAAP